jgi:hypothetical protein
MKPHYILKSLSVTESDEKDAHVYFRAQVTQMDAQNKREEKNKEKKNIKEGSEAKVELWYWRTKSCQVYLQETPR